MLAVYCQRKLFRGVERPSTSAVHNLEQGQILNNNCSEFVCTTVVRYDELAMEAATDAIIAICLQ